MKRSLRIIILAAAFAALFLLSIPLSVTAMGNSENAALTGINEDFAEIAADLQSGEIDRTEALEQLHALHDEKGNGDTDRLREMEQLLTAVEAKEMTAVQAQDQLRIHQESKTSLEENKVQQKEQNKTQVREKTNTQSEIKNGTPASETAPEAKQQSSGAGPGSASGGSGKSN